MECETRFVEFRVEPSGMITGVAIRYGDMATLGDFKETFQPDSIHYGDDVIVNIQHDRGRPVARIDSGLAIRRMGSELLAEIDAPDTVHGREARELVKTGILRGLSIEFRSERDRWHGKTRVIERAELVGIGIVDKPAYPASQIAQRWESAGSPTLGNPQAVVFHHRARAF